MFLPAIASIFFKFRQFENLNILSLALHLLCGRPALAPSSQSALSSQMHQGDLSAGAAVAEAGVAVVLVRACLSKACGHGRHASRYGCGRLAAGQSTVTT